MRAALRRVRVLSSTTQHAGAQSATRPLAPALPPGAADWRRHEANSRAAELLPRARPESFAPRDAFGSFDAAALGGASFDAAAAGAAFDAVAQGGAKTLVQRAASDAALAEYASGAARAQIVLPGGAGKTVTALRVTEALRRRGELDTVVLLAPSVELISQTYREWTRFRADAEVWDTRRAASFPRRAAGGQF